MLGTVRRAERTLPGHIRCELDTGDTRYDVLTDPHPLMASGRRFHAVLRPLHAAPGTPQQWHLLWCRLERPPAGEDPDNGSPDGVPTKD